MCVDTGGGGVCRKCLFLIHQNGENNDVCDFLRVEGNQQASLSPVMLLIFNVFFLLFSLNQNEQ